MTESAAHAIFFNEERLRSGWRIAIFFALFAALTAVGQITLAFLPAGAAEWAGYAVSFLAALVAGWIVLARLDGRPPGALGFALTAAAPREIGWGFVIGAILLVAAALMLLATGAVHWVADSGNTGDYLRVLVRTFLFFSIAAAWEELLVRGYPFQALVEGIGPWAATALSAAIFSGLHATNPGVGPLALLNIFLAGVLLSVAYLRTRSLWFATAIHVGWNWTMATLLDFPVSGLNFFDTPLYTAAETGADWWTGGAFGPEAGVAATLVLGAGVVALARTRRFGESRQMRALGPIVDRRLLRGAQ